MNDPAMCIKLDSSENDSPESLKKNAKAQQSGKYSFRNDWPPLTLSTVPSSPEDLPIPKSKQHKRVDLSPLSLDKPSSKLDTSSSVIYPSISLRDSIKPAMEETKQCETTEEFLLQVVKSEEVFRRLPPEWVVNVMYMRSVQTGETILRQGESSDWYFVITKGRFDILVENHIGKVEKVSVGQRGSTVGVSGLMSSSKCDATVKASTPSIVWVLEAQIFRRLFSKYRSGSYSESYLSFLKTVPILKSLPPPYLKYIATIVKEVKFAAGKTVVRQRDPSSFFYIIMKGKAVVLKAAVLHEEPVEVHIYGPTDFFGERGLILKQPRAATVVATTKLTCFVLNQSEFEEIGKILAKQFEEVITSYKDVERPPVIKFVNRIGTKLEEFEYIGVLGVGSFGRVSLVKDPNSKFTYSLKCVRKKRVVETEQQEHMKNERAVLALMDSSFIVKLFATYKDRKSVYFLMEAVLGGELFTVLRYNTKFSERTSRFYAGCCVLALQHMHTQNVIYRDIKPENLLLDARGYIKITDFGFAKKRNHTFTLCGTPEYLAPEVIQSWTQSFAVDWWGLGILIYEMVVSHPPFEDSEHMKMYEKIVSEPVEYPRHVSQNCRKLIDGLLRKNFYKRLGAGLAGAAAVKRHPWFEKTNWEELANRTVNSPYIPRIKSREDLSCYEYYSDDESKDEELLEDENSQVFAWADEF